MWWSGGAQGVRRWSGEVGDVRWWSSGAQGVMRWPDEAKDVRWWSDGAQGIRRRSGRAEDVGWWSGGAQGVRRWFGGAEDVMWWSGEDEDIRRWSGGAQDVRRWSGGAQDIRRNPAVMPDGERRPIKGARADDAASTITGDSLIVLHKKFHFLKDVVTMVLKSLREALRFPLPAELIEISKRCGVSLSQFSYRAMSGSLTFRSKWLDIRTQDPAKSWASTFFFVKNDWGLLEKWGKMRDLPTPLHVKEEDIMRILKVPDFKHLLYEVCYLNKYIEEEFLFKVGLFFHAGRLDARMLKPTFKVPEPPAPAPKVAPKRQAGGDVPQVLLKKKKLEGISLSTSKVPPDSSLFKFCIPGDVLSHQCIGRRKADDLVDLEETQATITQLHRDQKASVKKVAVLEAENKRSQTLITEKEAALIDFESLRVIENFKKSIAFKTIIQDRIQEAHDHIYKIEVKALEQQCIDEGFIRGFLKGVRLVQRKTGVEVEGLTPSQASDESPPDSGGDKIESEIQKAFSLEVDDKIVDIE
ncbi:hypothetical protein IEQ34_008003 [Dendrobium chrysotoxum]|uniref:Uncharacterized protein n=1 Tax=Dendrobium chrysotoxum TaxID=161865 RepID=A0AAV7H2X7_DENCH|nr:hypothetical protein IEQ34_008003 [Dendrobium chrysotoxum]